MQYRHKTIADRINDSRIKARMNERKKHYIINYGKDEFVNDINGARHTSTKEEENEKKEIK